MRYCCRMAEVASRELRNQTRALLDRVAAGEHLTITVDGRPVATMEPLNRRSPWMPRQQFIDQILANLADPGLSTDLAAMAGETTDELPAL